MAAWSFSTTVFLAINLIGSLAFFSKKSLYNDKDEITLLNASNFKSTIVNKENAWIVQFYNSWCGHCQKFASTWKDLGINVKGWRNVIGVAAIDCAESENVATCRDYDVTSFPTLKFFKSRSSEQEMGTSYKGSRDITAIQNAMIDFVTTDNPSPPSSWPNLHPVSYLDMNSLWRDVPSFIKYFAVLVEPSDSYLGRDVILSTQHLVRYIRVLRAVKNRAPFIESFKELTTPFLILIHRKGDLKTFTDSDVVREPYIQYLEAFAKNNTQWNPNEIAEPILQDNRIASITTNMSVSKISSETSLLYELDKVYLQDLENAIHYIFWQEVALQKTITEEKLRALASFLSILVKYLPARENTKSFLNTLNSWAKEQEVVSGKQLTDKINEIQKDLGFELQMKEWVGCQGSLPRFRGYTCGLWTMFHSLTVSAYRQNEKDSNFDVLEVLTAIREYVMNFFSCGTCVQHFTEMSANLPKQVQNIDDSVLWLWQAHNKVNERLKGDQTDDPAHPKVQFPTESLCYGCRTNNQWDLKAVLEFLISHYSDNIVGFEEPSAVDQNNAENIASTTSVIPIDLSVDISKHANSNRESVKKRDTRVNLIVPIENERHSNALVAKSSVLSKWGFGASDFWNNAHKIDTFLTLQSMRFSDILALGHGFSRMGQHLALSEGISRLYVTCFLTMYAGTETFLGPPRSPNLTTCDFFLWGYLKNKVFQNHPQNIPKMKI